MQKQNKNRTRRLRNMIATFSLTAIILSVSTYAWFVGLQTVNVTAFEVSIASTDSLSLSLDGQTWSDTVTISKENATSVCTACGNYWDDKGLIPVSTVGEIDITSSRMKIYEKASLTPTPPTGGGGYRLMASRINNHTETEEGSKVYPEQEGYIAFDLYIRNYSGRQYIADYNPLDEEAIYLTTDSKVVTSAFGNAGTGIENSVRVAFAQIGRVRGDVNYTGNASKITGIRCTDEENSVVDDVTGICTKGSTIWEPNDKQHVASAINWYNTSCRPRAGESTYNTEGTCSTVVNGTAYPTYAVAKEISSTDKIDIYDGPAYNGYTKNVSVWNASTGGFEVATGTEILREFQYFTDTMKDKAGIERPVFMTLAPNSITRIRVYVYIEGQDIDNYEFAAMGKQITINFGFTKERFEGEDFEYDGPPIVMLIGPRTVEYNTGDVYKELGATGYGLGENDTYTLVPTSDAETVLQLDENGVIGVSAGTYQVTYTVTDAASPARTATAVRTVIVK